MNISKLFPWNWFKREQVQKNTLPVEQAEGREIAKASSLDQFHAEFDRMVDSIFSRFGLPIPQHMRQWSGDGFQRAAIKPSVEIYEKGNDYVIEVDLPGVDEKDLNIELNDDMIILSARKHHEDRRMDAGCCRIERSYGFFRRVFNVPADADRERIKAKCSKGVLCITMPRTGVVEGKTRKIAVESAAAG